MAEQGDVSLLTFLLHITQFHAPFITGQYICILSFYVHDMYGKMIGEDAYNSLIIEFLRRNLPEVNSSHTIPIKTSWFMYWQSKKTQTHVS